MINLSVVVPPQGKFGNKPKSESSRLNTLVEYIGISHFSHSCFDIPNSYRQLQGLRAVIYYARAHGASYDSRRIYVFWIFSFNFQKRNHFF